MTWWHNITILFLVIAVAATLGEIIKRLAEIRTELQAIRRAVESDQKPPTV
jgi:hypothetical protein